MYVANLDNSGGTVSVIDSSSNTVVDTINVGLGPEQYIAFNPSNNDMYVSNSAGSTVSVIDSSSNTVVHTISVGGGPQGIAFNPSNNDMYVASGVGTVTLIDSSSNTVVDTIALVGSGHYRIAFNPTNNDMYVTNYDSGTVSVIDSSSNTVIKTIGVGSFPMAIAFNPSNNDMYVANFNSGTNPAGSVSVISGSTNTVVDTISVGDGATGIAFNPTNNDMYVTNENSNTVSVISTSTVVQPPTHTTITSAVDSNGAVVPNGGSTVSTSITFQVTATAGTNSIAGFQCSLDGSAFSSCATGNPATITYNNLAAGRSHTFEVRAVDTQEKVDSTPASFTWTILTPTQGIQKLIATINSFHLPRGVTTSLEAPLNAAPQQRGCL
jgi:YVTN family beta-propeller protein